MSVHARAATIALAIAVLVAPRGRTAFGGSWAAGCATPAPPVEGGGTRSAAPAAPAPVVAADAAAPRAPANPADAMVLAVGEAIVVDGTPVAPGVAAPSQVIDTMQYAKAQFVLMARAEGDATVAVDDAAGARTEKHFHVVAELCRDKPLHPTIVLDEGDRATVEVGGRAVAIEVTRRSPWVVSGSNGAKVGDVVVLGQGKGHATVIVVREDQTYHLFDAFVGGACKDKGYASIAPAVPPGFVGPKGDGTCVRTHDGKTFPAVCPDPAKAAKMSDAELSPVACNWAAACGIMGYEGCCIGCLNPFPMKLKRACALRTLRMKSCKEVQRELSLPACLP